MSEYQLRQWHADRARQSTLFSFSVPPSFWARGKSHSRGEWLRRANNGLALRTFRAARSAS